MRAFIWAGVGMVVLAASGASAAEPVRSGLQTGEKIASIFEPLNVNGPFAGERHCLVCENGVSPVAMIFIRELSEPLVRLIAKIDEATAKHKAQEMGSFVVMLSEGEGVETRLADVAKKQALKQIILSTFEPAGPEGFKVAKDADVTVVMYHDFDVKANHAFRKGELTDAAIDKILSDLPKILPSK